MDLQCQATENKKVSIQRAGAQAQWEKQ